MTALDEVLACLTANDPSGFMWTDTISATTRIDYLPTYDCPQWPSDPQCCTLVANTFNGCERDGSHPCDGTYVCDKGAGPTTCRIAGLTSLYDCPGGIVLVLPETCTQADGVTPAHSALKYELINALTAGAYDQQAWRGWQCS